MATGLEIFELFGEILMSPKRALSAVGVAALGIGGYSGIGSYDERKYGGEYVRLREKFAASSAPVCGLQNTPHARDVRLHNSIYADVDRFLGHEASLMPVKHAVEQLSLLDKTGIVLYPEGFLQHGTTYDSTPGVAAVFFEAGDGRPPVLAYYGKGGKAALAALASGIGTNGHLPDHNIVFHYAAAGGGLEQIPLESIPGSASSADGSKVTVNFNPCLADEGFRGKTGRSLVDRLLKGVAP